MEVLHTGYFVASWPYTPREDSLKQATLHIDFLNKSLSGNLGNFTSEACLAAIKITLKYHS